MKTASLWDIPRPTLDPEVFSQDGKLLPQHRLFLLDFLKRKLEDEGFTAYDTWISSVVMLGSLASYQYNVRSDVDFHVVVDLEQFADLEYHGAITAEQAHEVLEGIKKKINSEPEMLSGTNHPTEFTIHYKGYDFPRMPKNVGMYDLVNDRWEKEPTSLDLSPIAVEQLYPHLMDVVHGFAEKYEVQVTALRKDVVDVQYLREALAQFPPKYRPVLETEIQGKIDDINAQIDDYLARTKQLKDERHSGEYPVMPQELQLKYLSRYGYLWLAKQLKELELDQKNVEESDLPELEQTLKEVPKLTG